MSFRDGRRSGPPAALQKEPDAIRGLRGAVLEEPARRGRAAEGDHRPVIDGRSFLRAAKQPRHRVVEAVGSDGEASGGGEPAGGRIDQALRRRRRAFRREGGALGRVSHPDSGTLKLHGSVDEPSGHLLQVVRGPKRPPRGKALCRIDHAAGALDPPDGGVDRPPHAAERTSPSLTRAVARGDCEGGPNATFFHASLDARSAGRRTRAMTS